LKSTVWTVMFMIPFVHWFAMHRLLMKLENSLHQRSQAAGIPDIEDGGIGPLVMVSDIMWFLSMLPWGGIIILNILHNWWPSGIPAVAVPLCGILFAILFSIVNLAVLENLQRRFVALIRKL